MGATGVVTVPDAGPQQVWTGEDLQRELISIIRKQIELLKLDRAEVTRAKEHAKGRWFKDCKVYQAGYNEERSNQIFREVETKIIATLESLAGAKLIRENSDGLDDLPGLGDGEGIVKQWMETADAVKPNLHQAHSQWHTAMSDLSQVVKEAQTLTAKSWQSEAGNAYRAIAQERVAEADALRSLALNSRDAVHSVSLMQAVTAATIGKYLTAVNTEASKLTTVQNDFNNMNLEQIKSLGNFYQASNQMRAHVAATAEQIKSVEATNQEWLKVSKKVRDELNAAAEAARAAQAHASAVRESKVAETDAAPEEAKGESLRW